MLGRSDVAPDKLIVAAENAPNSDKVLFFMM